MRNVFLLLLLILGSLPALAAADAQTDIEKISGIWSTEGGVGAVELKACTDDARALCGRIVGMGKDNPRASELKDFRNPDLALRDRLRCGINILRFSKSDGAGSFDEGTIYNPNDGGRYAVQIKMVDDRTLNLRGYLWLPIFGATQTWRRAEDGFKGCDAFLK